MNWITAAASLQWQRLLSLLPGRCPSAVCPGELSRGGSDVGRANHRDPEAVERRRSSDLLRSIAGVSAQRLRCIVRTHHVYAQTDTINIQAQDESIAKIISSLIVTPITLTSSESLQLILDNTQLLVTHYKNSQRKWNCSVDSLWSLKLRHPSSWSCS